MSENTTEPEIGIRDELVRTAISFLQNPKVVNTPLAQKQKFLQRKGLTDEEVKKACELSGAYSQHEQQLKVPPPLPPTLSNSSQMQLSFFYRLRETVHSLAIFSIVGYALYKLYENYIAPFLFGRKKKNIEESLEILDKDIKNSVTELKASLESVKIEVDRISRGSEWNTERYLTELKSDISTVKGLLLGRKQFPSVSNSPVVPPSIPAWQMSSVPDNPDGDGDHKTEELEEIASGSGSSEPEHYTKTSESSLEIILSPKECEDVSYHSKSEDND